MKCIIVLLLIGGLGLSHVQGSTRDMVLENELISVGQFANNVFQIDNVLHHYHKLMVKAVEDSFNKSNYSEDFNGYIGAARDVASSTSIANKNKYFVEALNRFLSLAEAVDHCDYQSYKILTENYKAASIGTLQSTNLVNRAILLAIERHGQICRPQYLQQFRREYSKISREIKDRINFLVDNKLIKATFGSDFFFVVLDRKHFSNGFDNAIKILAQKLKAEYIHDGYRFEEGESFVDRYLIDPCIVFRDQLYEVFYPARLDLALDDAKIFEIDLDSDDNGLFRNTWMKFKFCDGVNYNPLFFQSKLNNATIMATDIDRSTQTS